MPSVSTAPPPARRTVVARRARPTARPTTGTWLFVGAVLLIPLLLALGKLDASPASGALREHVSLNAMSPELRDKVADILFVPVGALVVVTFRLTLGLRVLGPFRSVLLAFAFLATGIAIGIGFLIVTVAALVLARPLIKALRLPYFGRISVMLSLVAIAIGAGALVGSWVYPKLEEVAYMPVVVVCLVGEALARAVRREGARSGLWRATVTVAAAATVALLASLQPLRDLLLGDPELVFVPIAAIVVVSSFLDFRLLAPLNPTPARSGRGADDDDPLQDEITSEENEA